MILTWLTGVHGVTAGCGTIVFLREGYAPNLVDAQVEARAMGNVWSGAHHFAQQAELAQVAQFSERMLPLAVAQTLLATLLVAASAMVLAGRPGARSFAIQTVLANAVLALVGYLLKGDARSQWVATTVEAVQTWTLTEAERRLATSGYWQSWVTAQLILLQVVVFGGAMLSLLSKRTSAFLEASLRAEQRREREDEP